MFYFSLGISMYTSYFYYYLFFYYISFDIKYYLLCNYVKNNKIIKLILSKKDGQYQFFSLNFNSFYSMYTSYFYYYLFFYFLSFNIKYYLICNVC